MGPSGLLRMSDSGPVTRFLVDPARSSVTAVMRPALGGAGARRASATGEVYLTDQGISTGSITVTLDAEEPPDSTRAAVIALDPANNELSEGPDGEPVVQGRTSRPAGAFGLVGPPLLNPTVQLRWHLVLLPA
jgi:hypothetical protein